MDFDVVYKSDMCVANLKFNAVPLFFSRSSRLFHVYLRSINCIMWLLVSSVE
jgi:hypothetical protein